jgi:hypothetical protein
MQIHEKEEHAEIFVIVDIWEGGASDWRQGQHVTCQDQGNQTRLLRKSNQIMKEIEPEYMKEIEPDYEGNRTRLSRKSNQIMKEIEPDYSGNRTRLLRKSNQIIKEIEPDY